MDTFTPHNQDTQQLSSLIHDMARQVYIDTEQDYDAGTQRLYNEILVHPRWQEMNNLLVREAIRARLHSAGHLFSQTLKEGGPRSVQTPEGDLTIPSTRGTLVQNSSPVSNPRPQAPAPVGAPAAQPRRSHHAAVGEIRGKSMYDIFYVRLSGDRKILLGDCTGQNIQDKIAYEEAQASSHNTNVRFFTEVARGVPLNGLVRDYKSAEQLDNLRNRIYNGRSLTSA